VDDFADRVTTGTPSPLTGRRAALSQSRARGLGELHFGDVGISTNDGGMVAGGAAALPQGCDSFFGSSGNCVGCDIARWRIGSLSALIRRIHQQRR
jgi:hypothetical protein